MTTEYVRLPGEIEERARELAGNWSKFESFSWWGRDEELIPDPENWTIIYTSNRDSGLIDRSNAATIDRLLQPFTEGDYPEVVPQSHNHWACGYVDGYAIRCFHPDGKPTNAIREWLDIVDSLESYPILDESHYSDLEYNESIDNFSLAASGVKSNWELPEGWESYVFSWLSGSEDWCDEVCSCDDQGAWPSEEAFEAAFSALGYARLDESE